MKTLQIDDDFEYEYGQAMRRMKFALYTFEKFVFNKEGFSNLEAAYYDLKRTEKEIKGLIERES